MKYTSKVLMIAGILMGGIVYKLNVYAILDEALQHAIITGNIQVIQNVLQHETTQQIKDEMLTQAVWSNQIKIAQLLLEHRANVESQHDGLTLFMQAVMGTKWEMAELLLDYHADMNAFVKKEGYEGTPFLIYFMAMFGRAVAVHSIVVSYPPH